MASREGAEPAPQARCDGALGHLPLGNIPTCTPQPTAPWGGLCHLCQVVGALALGSRPGRASGQLCGSLRRKEAPRLDRGLKVARTVFCADG